MWSSEFSNEEVNVGSGLTRSRFVVRRALDWCLRQTGVIAPSGVHDRVKSVVGGARKIMVFMVNDERLRCSRQKFWS